MSLTIFQDQTNFESKFELGLNQTDFESEFELGLNQTDVVHFSNSSESNSTAHLGK